MEEVWKDVYDPNYSGYQASSKGRIRSFRDFHGNLRETPTILKLRVNKDGYYELAMNSNTRDRKTFRVHRVIANTFLGEHPGMVVNHINGNKLDNRIENLEFVTAAQNSTLAAESGLYKTMPVRIVETGEIFRSLRDCGKAINYHPSDISRCLSGKLESIQGLHFEQVSMEEYEKITNFKGHPFLYDYQMEAVQKLQNGNILVGSVGSGKSRSGLFYYFKENGGWIDENGYVPMKNPQDLYIITTAKKRDSQEWSGEIARYLMSTNPEDNYYDNKIVIDSWNNIQKYKDVVGGFFLLDEQRIVGSGAWVKSFLKIAKSNNWILLTATPADTYSDLLPVFLANGFFKNKSEFNREHVVYARYTKYPKIERYINTTRLDRLKSRVIVQMNYKHQIKVHSEDVYCSYDIPMYKDVMRKRWDPYRNAPIEQASGLCLVLRKIVNSDESRQVKLLELLEDIPRAIIFYNFDYEREILLNLGYAEDVKVAEWTGHAHQPVPDSEKWVYICQYNSAAEGWECTKTNVVIFYSQSYSYKTMTQAAGRIDRLNTPYDELCYYYFKSRSGIDLAISRSLSEKKNFNEGKWIGKW